MTEKKDFLQWFCGFYEGEGSVSNDMSNNNKIRLSIAQNDRTPLDMAQKFWGGSVRVRVRTTLTGKICTGHEWRMSHNESMVFIEDIKPFMLIPYKKQQIEKVLELAKLGLKRRFPCNNKDCTEDFASSAGRRRHFKTFHMNTDAKKNESNVA
jgi:hypothetical protein